MSTPQEIIDNAIANNVVVVFSKTWCGYSKRAKALLTAEYPDVKPVIFELDERDDGDKFQDYLEEKYNQRSVPNVFINQKHIGGSDSLVALHKKDGIRPLLN